MKDISTKVNVALVFRGNFTEVEAVKQQLQEAGIQIIYQKIAPLGTKLIIREGGDDDRD